MKKSIIISALGVMLMTSCADTWDRVYTNADPSIPEYAYLNDYKPLKEYDYKAKYPGFKIGLALDAGQYNQQQLVYALANSNFDEVVAGNAMKMSSCVDDKGNMDFGKVSAFVNNAEEAGMSVYGHTLAWHEQQPVKWLNSLIADKPIPVDPSGMQEEEVFSIDYTKLPSFPYFVMGYTPQFNSEEGLVSEYPGSWYQYFVCDNIPTKADVTEYYAEFEAKADRDMVFGANMGWGWGAGESVSSTVKLTTEWSKVVVKFSGVESGGKDVNVVFQPGTNEGRICLRNARVYYKKSTAAIDVPDVYYVDDDFSGSTTIGGWGNGSTRTVENGMLHIYNPSEVNFWEAQAAYDMPLPNEVELTMEIRIKGPAGKSFRAGFQNPSDYSGRGDFAPIALTDDWVEKTLKCTVAGENAGRFIFSFGDIAGDIYIDYIKLYSTKKSGGIPLTPEEKKEVLTNAMAQWCNAMMQETQGKVKAFDLINEAVSGEGTGFYSLQSEALLRQSLKKEGKDDQTIEAEVAKKFFWQDYFTPEEYGVIVEKAARDAYAAVEGTNPADLKLFINDYNLESDWDHNKKLTSLIHWIGVWESKGAKIDGIGTQMHISYYENETTLNNKKAAIENMLKLMVQTGKYVRISELDMGYYDANNNKVTTAQIEALPIAERLKKEQAMADYYKWIIEKYLEIVPEPQRWSICQWCATDAPGDSGWRAGEPVGLWNRDYQRKPTYAGWAEALDK